MAGLKLCMRLATVTVLLQELCVIEMVHHSGLLTALLIRTSWVLASTLVHLFHPLV